MGPVLKQPCCVPLVLAFALASCGPKGPDAATKPQPTKASSSWSAGEPVNGIRVRLRALRAAVAHGQSADVMVEITNVGEKLLYIENSGGDSNVSLDVIHKTNGRLSPGFYQSTFAPHFLRLAPVALDPPRSVLRLRLKNLNTSVCYYTTPEEPLPPGIYTIRAAFRGGPSPAFDPAAHPGGTLWQGAARSGPITLTVAEPPSPNAIR